MGRLARMKRRKQKQMSSLAVPAASRTAKPPPLKTNRLELLVANHFGTRANIIVPNVSWGLLNHEADILVLRPSGWAEEVELKVSRADLKRDSQKHGGRGHRDSDLVHKLWFAVPQALADDPAIPARAGILSAAYGPWGWHLETVRAPQCNKRAHKLTVKEIHQLMRLGMLRIWTLKQKLLLKQSCLDMFVKRSEEADDGMAGSEG